VSDRASASQMAVADFACRGCGRSGLEVFLSLGEMPLANRLLTAEQLDEPEPRYPLDVALCEGCGLVQLTESVPPREMFEEYAYFSSASTTMVEHARSIARRMVEERHLGPDDLVVELASNDGYLLQHYRDAGIPVLGIDPARNIATVAERLGIPTLCAFFGTELAEEMRASGRRASVLHANNVLAHVPDINGFVRGIARVLADDGIAVIETPYVRDLVDRLEFDTIYHEHLFYHSVTALDGLFQRNGLALCRVEHLPIHGGSLRLFAGRAGVVPDPSIGRFLADEEKVGLVSRAYFRGFGERVEALCRNLRGTIEQLRREGRRVGAYGAAAKGTILLNAAGIGAESIEYVCDRSDYKQGRFMPGVRIPIVSPERLVGDMPDDVLLLVWNFADEVLAQQAEYRARGGRFLIPIPEPRFLL